LTSGSGNVCIGYDSQPSSATASNEISFGAAATNAGTVTIGVLAPTSYWNVRINGVACKILLA
jgi:phosphomannomutase